MQRCIRFSSRRCALSVSTVLLAVNIVLLAVNLGFAAVDGPNVENKQGDSVTFNKLPAAPPVDIDSLNIAKTADPDGNQAENLSRSTGDRLTSLTEDPVQALLLVSTLDGSLVAVDRRSGEVRWTVKDEPAIRVPFADKVNPYPKPPFFLPDPRSGSLYWLGRHSELKKLPFTIPKYVQNSPCRNSDGIFYSGKKIDTWVSLDPLTGEKVDMHSSVDPESDFKNAKPASEDSKTKSKKVFIAKTEYTISMLDGDRKYNVTYQDYVSNEMNKQSMQEYDLVHFASPSTGTMLTYDRTSGELLWQSNLKSPVVRIYTIDETISFSSLISVPFTPIASETLERMKTIDVAQDKSKLVSTVYVGECPAGIYAIQSFVDDTFNIISSSADSKRQQLLLEGPDTTEAGTSSDQVDVPDLPQDDRGDYLLLGHYELPKAPSLPLKQIEGERIAEADSSEANGTTFNGSVDDHVIPNPSVMFSRTPTDSPNSTPNVFPIPPPKEKPEDPQVTSWLVLIFSIVSGVTASIVLIINVRRDPGRRNFLNYRKWLHRRPSDTSNAKLVGKITFDPTQILGQGCEGTIVFKGKFEDRSVAVKRIIPECFAFADREVDLLKESDEHMNVVRYFCTEQDAQFKYIALELCDATVSDWIEGKFVHDGIDPLRVLREATDGLAHLHSLRIVHRDIKPANVLLSVTPKNQVKAMISDFGLCKKLPYGRASFSRRSGGVPGTEGWIAPELLQEKLEEKRATHAVDVFSLGCVYYYVLTNGSHPFGEPYHRQANIIFGKSDLSRLSDDHQVGLKELIERMVAQDSDSRPQPASVLLHPMFWPRDKILSFFLDVSDRIEKGNENTCPLLMTLENDDRRSEVVRDDWREHICPEVALDLRKYRTYRGDSVRDLLRALRNKKNHYRELTAEAQASLGQIPDQFTVYWTSRFPLLLPYAWSKCELVKSEPIFSKYYCPSYNFYVVKDLKTLEAEMSELNSDSVSNSEKPGGSPRQILTKNFWKSKNQYNRFKKRPPAGPNFPGNVIAPTVTPSRLPPEPDPSAGIDSENWRNPSS